MRDIKKMQQLLKILESLSNEMSDENDQIIFEKLTKLKRCVENYPKIKEQYFTKNEFVAVIINSLNEVLKIYTKAGFIYHE